MEGWVVLELMGHVRLIGQVAEVEVFGSKLGRIDVLQRDGSTLTQYFGAASVYRITPTTEEAAREMMKPYEPFRYNPSLLSTNDEIAVEDEVIDPSWAQESDPE